MVKKQALVKMILLAAVFVAVLGVGAPLAMAQEAEHGEAAAGGGGLGALGLGIGAGLAVGLAGLGTGLTAHFVFGIGDAIALGAKVGILFWLSLAMTVALHNVAMAKTPPARS